MQKRMMWTICFLIFVALAVSDPSHAQTENQSKPAVYTYVAHWVVPRAQWADMAKQWKQEQSDYEKLLADGVITGYGTAMNFIHTEGGETHAAWFTATSEANILKALEGFYAQPQPPVEDASKHWDSYLVSHTYDGRPGTFDGAYLEVSGFQVKPGQGEAFRNLIKSRVVPVFDKLVADGTLVAYSVQVQNYDTQRPGQVSLVTITPNAAGIDKIDAAFEAAFGKDPEIGPALGSLTIGKDHRDALLRVTHMVAK